MVLTSSTTITTITTAMRTAILTWRIMIITTLYQTRTIDTGNPTTSSLTISRDITMVVIARRSGELIDATVLPFAYFLAAN